jgi:hypothetical protein
MTNTASENCWICGDPASTREHKTKRSDLKSLFVAPTQSRPVFMHTNERRNIPVGSFDSKAFKHNKSLCPKCNNALTQPHDRAWECASDKLRNLINKERLSPGNYFLGNTIFPDDTDLQMLNVHLYWVKMFGCTIVDGCIRIDTDPFAEAIKKNKAMPNLYIAFGILENGRQVGAGHVETINDNMNNGICVAALRIFTIGTLQVMLIYSAPNYDKSGLENTWNPLIRPSEKIIFWDFNKPSSILNC